MNERLCGGIFLTLISEAAKPKSKVSVSFMGVSRPASDPFRLYGLLKILNHDHLGVFSDSFSKQASRYRNCYPVGYGADLPLNDSRYTYAFHERVLKDYSSVLKDMRDYADAFLDTGNFAKMDWLARALLEVLIRDSTGIRDVYILPGGAPADPVQLTRGGCEINLPALMAGCWDYIVMHVPDNTVGRSACESWFYPKADVHETARLREHIGRRMDYAATVTLDIPEPVMHVPNDAAGRCAQDSRLYPKADVQETAGSRENTGGQACYAAALTPDIPEPVREAAAGGKEPAYKQAAPVNTEIPKHPEAPGCVQHFYGPVNYFCGGANATFYNAPSTFGVNAIELSRLDKKLYNLFVVENEDFTEPSFVIPLNRSLREGIHEDLRKQFWGLTAQDVERLKNMPAVFMQPNTNGSHTDEYRQAILGRVTDLKVLNTSIRFSWKAYRIFPQEILNLNAEKFRIWRSMVSNELDTEHWTVKESGLIEALLNAGINPYAI